MRGLVNSPAEMHDWAGVFLAILEGLDSSVNGGSK